MFIFGIDSLIVLCAAIALLVRALRSQYSLAVYTCKMIIVVLCQLSIDSGLMILAGVWLTEIPGDFKAILVIIQSASFIVASLLTPIAGLLDLSIKKDHIRYLSCIVIDAVAGIDVFLAIVLLNK